MLKNISRKKILMYAIIISMLLFSQYGVNNDMQTTYETDKVKVGGR